MDVVLYVVAAVLLLFLIVFAVKLRGRTEAADREEHQNVVVRAAARPQAAEERPAGMPRRRRNLHSRVNVQRAQRPSDNGRAGRARGEEEDAGAQRSRETERRGEGETARAKTGGGAAALQGGAGAEGGGGVPAAEGVFCDRGSGRSRGAQRARVSQPAAGVHPVCAEI
uniref:DDRGK domain containing 1 n=1 Tax=Cyprinus carpio carpio TaxID=630221 RepID=A0A8C1DIF4_CYPCA